MSVSTDKLRARSLRSGLSALGSGGRRFEEGSHLCFTYLKKKLKKKKKKICMYVRTGVPDLLGGSSVGWVKSG